MCALPPTRGGKKLFTTAMRIARPRAGPATEFMPPPRERARRRYSLRFLDQVPHPVFDGDQRLPAQHVTGAADVGGAPRDQHVTLVEQRLDVDADGLDEDLGQR